MDNEHYFGEWVEYHNEEEKEEAIKYLALWKKFFIRKVPDLKFDNHDQIVLRPDVFGMGKNTIGIKICGKGKKPKNVLNLRDLSIN
jgi:hypothetical protein